MIEISKLKKNNEWVSEFSDSLYVLYIIKKIKESNSKEKLVKLSKYA